MLRILKILLGDISILCFAFAFCSFLGGIGVIDTHGRIPFNSFGIFCVALGYITKFLRHIIRLR
jgi:hypothetical protein